MDTPKRDNLDYVDLVRSAGFTRLFNCFRMAMAPSRLGLALLLIIASYAGGRTLDVMWGKQVYDNEFQVYSTGATTINTTDTEASRGVFDATLEVTIATFEKGVRAVAGLNFGFDQLAPGAAPNDSSIIGACRTLFITMPMWLISSHPAYTSVYALVLLLLWSLLGGAISRQMATEATIGQTISAGESIAFVWRRWLRYIFAPVLPMIFVVALGLMLAIAGLLLRVWGLNVIVGVLFFLVLGIAFVMALLLVVWFAGVHLLYPGLSTEGTDALEVLARAFSYVLARPWRLLGYTVVALIYGTITYLFVGLFIFIMITVAHLAMGLWAGDGFNDLFPQPRFAEMRPEMTDTAAGPYKATGVLIAVWLRILIGVLGAYAISFYFAAYTQVYLLLRRWTDGTDCAEVFLENATIAVPVRDKVEPAKPAAPAPKDDADADNTSPEDA
ncbi:MAG: hypothetical protein GC159_21775 [Phycisphaera sp.]|nr:hypothetical protein [Phycisphaera sp.]